jgi:hypothetical protein
MSHCVNCNAELNGYPLVCPYCHTNPAWFGSAPYSGIQGLQGSGGPGLLDGWISGLSAWWNKPRKLAPGEEPGPNETTFELNSDKTLRYCSSCSRATLATDKRCGGAPGNDGSVLGCGKTFVESA